jgi:hypothetical protein
LNAAPVSTVGDGPLPRLRRKRDERRTLKSLEEALIAERHADEHFVESADRGMCHQATWPNVNSFCANVWKNCAPLTLTVVTPAFQ